MDKRGVLPETAIGGRTNRGYNSINDKPGDRASNRTVIGRG
jgi:hypothetical protein